MKVGNLESYFYLFISSQFTKLTIWITEGFSPVLEGPTATTINPVLENPTAVIVTHSNKEQSKKELSNNNNLQEKKSMKKKVVVNSENSKSENQVIKNFAGVGFGIDRIKKFISQFGFERMSLVWLEYLDNQ